MTTDGSHSRFNWRPWAAVIATLAVAGAAHRLLADRMDRQFARRIDLPVPLSQFPLRLDGWTGVENALDPQIQDYLRRTGAADDFIHRRYTQEVTRHEVGFYFVYCARPRAMLGHRPQVCYPANGWLHVRTDEAEIRLPDGRALPCLIHRFRRPELELSEVVVLNYYVLNGIATNDEGRFAGFGWRRPNIEGNPAYYVAQVQMSSGSESALRALAAATLPAVLDFLPDADGRVRAARDPAQAHSQPNVPPPVCHGPAQVQVCHGPAQVCHGPAQVSHGPAQVQVCHGRSCPAVPVTTLLSHSRHSFVTSAVLRVSPTRVSRRAPLPLRERSDAQRPGEGEVQGTTSC